MAKEKNIQLIQLVLYLYIFFAESEHVFKSSVIKDSHWIECQL